MIGRYVFGLSSPILRFCSLWPENVKSLFFFRRVRIWFQMKTRYDYVGEKFTKATMETSIRKTDPEKNKMNSIQFKYDRSRWFRCDADAR